MMLSPWFPAALVRILHERATSTTDDGSNGISTHSHVAYKNDTIISTVSIRVTPRDDHFISWSVLWGGFILTAITIAWQIRIERSILNAQRAAVDVENAVEAVSTADVTRNMVREK
jgi:hypothetical protein